MLKILFVVNKYVSCQGGQKFYPFFLRHLATCFKEKDIHLKYVFFGKDFENAFLTPDDFFYERSIASVDKADLEKEANRIENAYGFTFKQGYYPEMMQASDFAVRNNLRAIHLPEDVISDLDHLVDRFNYVENIILNENIDVVISDQSTDAEIEFARAICLKKNKLFFRIWPDFLGKRSIHQEYEFCKDKAVEAVYDPDFSYEKAEAFLDDYLDNERSPYPPEVFYHEPSSFQARLKRNLNIPSVVDFISGKRLYRVIRKIVMKLFYFVERLRKDILNSDYDATQNYIFWGFHLTTEATISLRGLPYLTQTSLIESISRVLPYGYFLYVREHPSWRNDFKLEHLKKLSELPNVRVISTGTSIHTILRNSKGVITYNATTGIEALMHGKPVLSFSPNMYYTLHPAADYCSDLYELGAKLVRLVNMNVEREDTISYLQKMFQITNDVPMEAESFFSKQDAVEKAEKLSRHLKEAFDMCLHQKDLSNGK